MSPLWLLLAGYLALVVRRLIAVGLAPEGHEEDCGFHFVKPQMDGESAGGATAEGERSGVGYTLATKGNA
jgi:hypothetical protein